MGCRRGSSSVDDQASTRRDRDGLDDLLVGENGVVFGDEVRMQELCTHPVSEPVDVVGSLSVGVKMDRRVTDEAAELENPTASAINRKGGTEPILTVHFIQGPWHAVWALGSGGAANRSHKQVFKTIKRERHRSNDFFATDWWLLGRPSLSRDILNQADKVLLSDRHAKGLSVSGADPLKLRQG